MFLYVVRNMHELDAINPNVTLLYLDKAGAAAAITVTIGVGV